MRSNKYLNQKLFLIFFGFFFLLISQKVFADSVTKKTTASSEQKVISHQTNEALEIAFAGIERQRKTIKDYEERIANSEGTKKQILEAWLDKSWLKLLEQGVAYAETVDAKKMPDSWRAE